MPMLTFMKPWRNVVVLLALATASGCASSSRLEAGFGKGWHNNGGAEARAILARLAGRSRAPRPAVAVGLSGRELVGQELSSGSSWRYSAEANVLPSISGGSVAFSSGEKIVVLDAKTGTKRFELASADRRLEAYASDDTHALLLLVDEHDARPDLLLVTDRSGNVLSEVTTLERVGAPWVGSGIGLIPWASQYVSAIDLETGRYLGRFLARTAPNRVLETQSGLFLSGGAGLVPLNEELAKNPNLPAATFSVRGFPGEPEWPIDGSKPRVARSRPISIAATPKVAAGQAKIHDDRFIATYFQLAAAFSVDQGAPLWVSAFARSITGISTGEDGALVCLDDGSLYTLDWSSGSKQEVASLDARLSACAVEVGELKIERRTAEPVEGRILAGIRGTGPSMSTFQQFLIEKLSTVETDAATETLIALSLDPLTSNALLATVRAALERRTVGYDVMIRALNAQSSSELGSEAARPLPYASLARTLARADRREAAPPLSRALASGLLSGPDALEVASAVLLLGGDSEIPPLREFFIKSKNIATDSELRQALVQTARFLWRRGGATRQDIEQLALEKMTHPELRAELAIAFAEETNARPSERKHSP